MPNDKFYAKIFDRFWDRIDRKHLVTDGSSMFGDARVFDWLVSVVKPSEIIEIGSWHGHSANYMIDSCKKNGLSARLVCVDTFLGGPEHWVLEGAIEGLHRENGLPTVYNRFLANVLARGNAGLIFPLTVDSHTASVILSTLGFKADLIFVDAGHDPQSVKNDIMKFVPLLSEQGVMFGDDYQFEPLAGAVHECALELGVQVLVVERKWIFVNQALLSHLSIKGAHLRQSFEGFGSR